MTDTWDFVRKWNDIIYKDAGVPIKSGISAQQLWDEFKIKSAPLYRDQCWSHIPGRWADDVRDLIRKVQAELGDKVRFVQIKEKWCFLTVYFESDSDERAGALAGLAMMFILGPEKPTISYARVGDEYKISGRGTDYLVKRKGVDLALALKTAAESLGGRGGGHPPAAGASVPAEGLDDLISSVDQLVGAQLKDGGEGAR